MPQTSRKTRVVASETAPPEAPVAEVRVAKNRLVVTLPMPTERLSDAVVFVTSSTLNLRSVPGRGNVNVTYPLPVEAKQGAFVARELNGVLDITILRAPRKSR